MSVSLPERTPQKSAARVSSRFVRFTTNSPVLRIRSWEYRSRLTDTDSMGGSVQTVPAHATVRIFGLPSGPAQLTIATGTG